MPYRDIRPEVKRDDSRLKLDLTSMASYNTIPPSYQYVEQFGNNAAIYREGTQWYGIFLAFASGTFFTISSALVKAVRSVDPMILLIVRALLQITVMLTVALRTNQNPFGAKEQRWLIHFQGIVGGATLALLYYSFRKLPLGDATTIIFSSPIIVIALSFLFLKEPCGLLRLAVVCTLFAGVIFVSRPPFLFQMHRKEPYNVLGYACALLASLFTALNIVIMRKCSEIHYSVIVLNLSWWSLVTAVSFFFLVSDGAHVDLRKLLDSLSDWFAWMQMALVAITGLCGQVLVTKALKIEGAGKVSVTRSLDIILAYLIQVYGFGEKPTSSSIAGAILILFSVFAMGFEKEIYSGCDFIP